MISDEDKVTNEELEKYASGEWVYPSGSMTRKLSTDLLSTRKSLSDALAENEILRGQLKEANEDADNGWLYAKHVPTCGAYPDSPCGCGYTELLKQHMSRLTGGTE
jgi:hypothetical protein